MREEYRSKKFTTESLDRIGQCNEIIDDYAAQGLRLTLRQLFYQLVSRALLSNEQRSYKNLSTLVSDARLAGLMDWDAIEDRGRQPRAASEFKDLAELAEAAIQSYRLPRWHNQDSYAELWCFPPTTLVTTPDGVAPIAALEVGDLVIDAQGVARRVRSLFRRRYVGRLVEVRARGLLPFCLTPNHPVRVEQWTGTGVGSSRGYSPREFVRADRLRKHDLVIVPRVGLVRDRRTLRMAGGPRTVNTPTVKVDSAFCSVAGLYLAEGSVRGDGRTLQFTFHRKETAYAEVVKAWATVAGFKWSEAFGAGTRIVYVFGKAAAKFFGDAFGSGSWNKRFPLWAMTLPHAKQMKMLEYYFRGDGSLWDVSRSALSVGTRSETLARQVQLVLMRCGHAASLCVVQDHGQPFFRVTIGGVNAAAVGKKWSLPLPVRKYRFSHMKVRVDGVACPIGTLREVPYEGDVYNIEVEKTNSYCVPCAVHNCEKDALAGILWPLARQFHVSLQVNKGYSSQSAMYEAAARFKAKEYYENTSTEPAHSVQRRLVLLYLGDHDPSGEDMVRDIRERLSMFGVEVDVRKIALTIRQVRQYNPPPNPAKITDPRAVDYIRKHGEKSWEVDALPPEVLSQLIRAAFAELVDESELRRVLKLEERDKKRLRKAVEKLTDQAK
jgi:hypothetical protein